MDHDAKLAGLFQPAMHAIFKRRADIPTIDEMNVFGCTGTERRMRVLWEETWLWDPQSDKII